MNRSKNHKNGGMGKPAKAMASDAKTPIQFLIPNRYDFSAFAAFLRKADPNWVRSVGTNTSRSAPIEASADIAGSKKW